MQWDVKPDEFLTTASLWASRDSCDKVWISAGALCKTKE